MPLCAMPCCCTDRRCSAAWCSWAPPWFGSIIGVSARKSHGVRPSPTGRRCPVLAALELGAYARNAAQACACSRHGPRAIHFPPSESLLMDTSVGSAPTHAAAESVQKPHLAVHRRPPVKAWLQPTLIALIVVAA